MAESASLGKLENVRVRLGDGRVFDLGTPGTLSYLGKYLHLRFVLLVRQLKAILA